MKIEFNFEKRRIKNFVIAILLTTLLIVIDQLTKAIATDKLKGKPPVPLIEGVFQFRYLTNPGAAFGSLENSRWVFMVFSTLAIIAMLVYLFYANFVNEQTKLYNLSVATILAGGIGNMIDRTFYGEKLFQGEVVDFLDFCLIDFAVFNFADSCVCVGAGLLILALILDLIKESRAAKSKGKS